MKTVVKYVTATPMFLELKVNEYLLLNWKLVGHAVPTGINGTSMQTLVWQSDLVTDPEYPAKVDP